MQSELSELSLGEQLFRQRFHSIEEAIQAVARRKGLGREDSQELYSLVMLKIIQHDYAILRDFQGRSRWRTYMTVVVCRVLLDERVRLWGRWRPSAVARRLGPTAVWLERQINRDGWSPSEAVADLKTRGVEQSAGQLEALTSQLPRRVPRRLLPAEPHLDHHKSETVDSIEVEQCEEMASSVKVALAGALGNLPDVERRLVELRFGRGWTVRRIAKSESVAERPLYSRFSRILRRLRHGLEEAGFGWAAVDTALSADIDLGPGFGRDIS